MRSLVDVGQVDVHLGGGGPTAAASAATAAADASENTFNDTADSASAPSLASSARRRTTREERLDELRKHFHWVPERFRSGPWSPLAWLTLVVWFALLCVLAPGMVDSAQSADLFANQRAFAQDIALEALSTRWCLACLVAVWTVGNCLRMAFKWTPWVFLTFTLFSYSLLALRFVSQVLGAWSPLIGAFGEVLRLPALMQASITFVVWNFVLVPAIYHCMPDAKRKQEFVDFNKGYWMCCIHVLNFPTALLEVYLSPRPLVWADLWIALLFVYAYALFYLFVCDRNGIFLYPIFTPRTHLCAIPYLAILGLYFLGFRSFQCYASLLLSQE